MPLKIGSQAVRVKVGDFKLTHYRLVLPLVTCFCPWSAKALPHDTVMPRELI